MSLANIKNQIVTNLATVSGVTRVYDDYPDVSPISADLPAIIVAVRDPFLSVEQFVNDQLNYNWHFNVIFLYKALGQDTLDKWDSGIEPFPARIINVIAGDLTLGGYCTLAHPSGNFSLGTIAWKTSQYWGFQFDLDVLEAVTTTFAA